MRFAFLELPGTSPPLARPVLPVQVEDLVGAPLRCLLDSGATANRLPAWLAAAAGLDLDDASDEDRIVVAGLETRGRLVRADLTIAAMRFQAPVWFCEPWPYGFGLLGQEGFFRFFRVTFCAAESWVDVEPEEGAIPLVG